MVVPSRQRFIGDAVLCPLACMLARGNCLYATLVTQLITFDQLWNVERKYTYT